MRVLVLRALSGLGDLVCAVPALRALRVGFPDAHITLVGAPGAQWFPRTFPDLVDRWEPLTGWPGIPEAPGTADAALHQLVRLRSETFDVACQLHGDDEITNVWIDLVGARRTALMTRRGHWVPDGALVSVVDAGVGEVERQLAVVSSLGVDGRDRALSFPVTAAVPDVVRALGPYAVVHPGSSTPSRRWPPRAFARVVATLRAAALGVVLTGTAAEREVTTAVRELADDPAVVDLAGRTSLDELAAVVAGARGVVTNDSGPGHPAAALGRPVLVVFHQRDWRRWLPVGDDVVPLAADAAADATDALISGTVQRWAAGADG